MERRLAAIMFTDIVGYTSLMESDEDQAFALLKKNREIHQKLIDEYHGTLIKEMGDGMLISFDLAADAVHCAVEIQKMSKDEMDAQIRIGIHSGDITFENEDVFGDGVNLASRLHSIADPGGIYISESLQKSIRSKSDINTKYLGEFNLKNVDYPVRTYAILGDGLPVPSTAKIYKLSRKSLKQRIFGSSISYIVFLVLLVSGVWLIRSQFFSEKTSLSSLLVLPFENYTGDEDLEYFVAGMHSSLIGDIGKISDLRVISKTTSRAYKNSEMSLPEIASELGINTVVEASVLCLGDSVCFQVKVMSAYPEEKQLWVQDYYVEKSQILNLYNRVTKEISASIDVVLTPEESELLAESRTVDPEAYDAYMKGQFYLDQIADHTLKVAAEYFKQAVKIDPSWATPYAGLAEVYGYQMQMGFVAPQEALPPLYENLEIALELNPSSANSHHVKAVISVWGEWNWEKGQEEFLRALQLNPNNALTHVFYGHLLLSINEPEEAMKHCDLAIELDPLRPFILGLAAIIKIDAGDYASAIDLCQKALSIDPNHFFANGALEMAYYQNGNYSESLKILSLLSAMFILEEERIGLIEEVTNKDEYIEALNILTSKMEKTATAGGFVLPWDIGKLYLRSQNTEQAMDWFAKGYEIHDPNMPYLSTKIEDFDRLTANERYLELLDKLKLPVRP